ncbi:cytochrome P450 [Xylariaceae sp. FL0255]|nr:cytochrome P450 [Xylariaceae sp. FL0255]
MTSLFPPDLTLFSVLIAAFIIIGFCLLHSPERIPTINDYRWDFCLRKAHASYLQDAQNLIAEGVAKYDGPFRIITTIGSRVILPARYTNWVKNCSDLDHAQFVADEYFARYPGFEANAIVVDPSQTMIQVTKTKLNQKSQCQIFEEHLNELLEDEWSSEHDWKTIDWNKDAPRLVGRMSAAVFVGPDLARNSDWQKLILNYTFNLFNGVRALRTWPAFLRPVVHWFLPECKVCRQQLRVARGLLHSTFMNRKLAKRSALAEGGEAETYADTISWMEEQAAGRPFDPAAAQLAFAISALHTTTELLKQVLLDICMHPELIQPLRMEITAVLAEERWTTAGVFKMRLLDSVIKETQRLKPGSLVNLERKALRDIVMPNKTLLPKGTNIAVDTSNMWSSEIYENPDTYDGHRFLKLRQNGGPRSNAAQLVSGDENHIAFGLGRSICPGRFMVANEIKVAIASILLKYDVRLTVRKNPQVIHYGFEMLADPKAKLEVRRRQ